MTNEQALAQPHLDSFTGSIYIHRDARLEIFVRCRRFVVTHYGHEISCHNTWRGARRKVDNMLKEVGLA